MQTTLRTLRDNGVLGEASVTSFAERQRLVDKPMYDAMEAARRARSPESPMRC